MDRTMNDEPFSDVVCSLCGCDRLLDGAFGFPTVCSNLDCPDPIHDYEDEDDEREAFRRSRQAVQHL